MTTMYKAFDGMMFDSEKQCEEYEDLLRYGKVGEKELIVGVDFDGNLLPIDDYFCDKVEVIKLSNADAVEVFRQMCERRHWKARGIYGPGVYVLNSDWSPEEGCWEKVDDLVQGHVDEIEKLKALKGKVE